MMDTIANTGIRQDSQAVKRDYPHGPPVLAMATLLFLSVCGNANSEPGKSWTEATPAPAPTSAQASHWGVEVNHIAKDVKPGDDFYRYVNKGWLDTAKIPQGFSGIESFTELALSTEKQVNGIIKEAVAKNAAHGTPEQQVADLYVSYVDIQRRNQRGFESLKGGLNDIKATKDRAEIASLMGRAGFYSPFLVFPTIDAKNPQRYILELDQSGLGLPNRDYYLNQKEPFIGHRSAYLSYIKGVFQRAGIDNAGQRAKAILDVETQIAKQQWSLTQLRDPVKTYHAMSVDQLRTYAAGFDWTGFLKESGYGEVATLQLSSDTAIKGIAAVFAKTPVDTLRDYVAFHYLNNYAPMLSEEWENASFDLFSRRLEGIAQQRSLEDRAVQFVSASLGEEIGKLYVERYFPPESKAKTEEMIGFILQSMKAHLEQLDWMDEPTRKEALAKLASFGVQVGYPSQYHDYSAVNIAKDDLIGNVHQLQNWYRNDARAKLNEPVRKWEWGHQPQEVNAYYAPDMNQIVFLAAILHPPFFDPNADPAVNFGAIGAVIGHEIGHGFDDQGSQYDGTGKLRNWWTKQSSKRFKEKTNRLVAQYNNYSPIAGVRLNGQLTLGENIGDMGGVSLAFGAYQKYAAAKYPNGTPPVLDGFTGNQRFFLGYAQVWRSLMTDDRARLSALTDPHSPGEFRTNGIVRNFDPWYEAFGVSETNTLFLPKPKRISIW